MEPGFSISQEIIKSKEEDTGAARAADGGAETPEVIGLPARALTTHRLKPLRTIRRHVDRRLTPRDQIRNDPPRRRPAAQPHVPVPERIPRVLELR